VIGRDDSAGQPDSIAHLQSSGIFPDQGPLGMGQEALHHLSFSSSASDVSMAKRAQRMEEVRLQSHSSLSMLISDLPSENCPSEEHTLSRHAQTALATPIKSCCIACAIARLLSSPFAFPCTASGLRGISTSCNNCNSESARSQCLPSQIVPLTPRLHDFEPGYAYLLALISCSIKRAFRVLW